MTKLTPKQYTAIAELLRLRSYSESYQMARMVLVEGMDTGEAAREFGVPYAKAWDAVKRVERGLELAHRATG